MLTASSAALALDAMTRAVAGEDTTAGGVVGIDEPVETEELVEIDWLVVDGLIAAGDCWYPQSNQTRPK